MILLDPIICFDYVGEDYSYDQCTSDYRAYMSEMYAYEAKEDCDD